MIRGITYKVSDLIVKTKENGVYRFDKAKFEITDNTLTISPSFYKRDKICFPLENVISYSYTLED